MLQEKQAVSFGRKIRDIYCYSDFYLNRGLGIFNSAYQIVKYTAFSGILVTMFNEAFKSRSWYIPMDKVFFFAAPLMVFLVIAGILDVKKIKSLQKINEISTKYNPVFSRMDRQIKKIYGKQVGNTLNNKQ